MKRLMVFGCLILVVLALWSAIQAADVQKGILAPPEAAVGSLDDSYDYPTAGGGRTINATDGAVTITSTDADTAYLLAVTPTPGNSAALGGISIVSGSNCTQNSLTISNAGDGYDLYATGGYATISKTGVGIFSALQPTGDITLATAKALQTSTSAGHSASIKVRDDNGEAYRNVLSWTNADTPVVVLGAAQNTLQVASTGLNVSTGGAVSGVASITFTSTEILATSQTILTANAIATLYSTPVTLVSASTGNIIQVLSVVLCYNYSGAAFSDIDNNIGLHYTDGSGAACTSVVSGTGLLDQTGDKSVVLIPAAIGATSSAGIVNTPVVIAMATGNPTKGSATSTLTVSVTYKLIPTGF